MAKESTSSRIPRLDGVSRIPMPGNIRPQKLNTRPAQIMRPPTTFSNQRPTTFSALRPPILGGNAIKKSSSGDRINNVVNMMSRKTNTALKKFFCKPERASQQTESCTAQQVESKHLDTTQILSKNEPISMLASTPRPLKRSDTFIRDESHMECLSITQDIFAQSTPAPSAGKRPASEVTHMLRDNACRALYTTQSLDVVARSPAPFGDTITLENKVPLYRALTLENTRTSGIGFGKTINVESPGATTQILDNTVCVESPLQKQGSCTQAHCSAIICFDSPIEQLKQQMSLTAQNITKCLSADLSKTLHSDSKSIDATGIVTPATNATYSNPGSTDNLLMLEDVSIPSDFDLDVTLQAQPDMNNEHTHKMETSVANLDGTLKSLTPDKAKMKLPLNSTMTTERLLDFTGNMLSSPGQVQLFNLTKDYLGTPQQNNSLNTTQLLYMTQISSSATTTPDRNAKFSSNCGTAAYKHTPVPTHLLSPLLLKGAKSDIVLPTRTPDDDLGNPMDVDSTLSTMGARTEQFFSQQKETNSCTISLQDVNSLNLKSKSRFSFGLDLTESTLDCSIELVDVSLSSTALSQANIAPNMPDNNSMSQSSQQLLKKQNSFDLDESLGILTPDQMKEFLDSTTTNTNNLDLPLAISAAKNAKLSLHQMRIDQTPSPEELPLDPVEVKTDRTDFLLTQHQQQHAAFSTGQQQQNMQQPNLQSSSISTEPVSLHTDTDLSKTDQLIKSSVSKISTSFITSVTSVTSLDTGYQGDGEMSRPASRGAGDHSPSNASAARKGCHVSRQPSFNQQQAPLPPIRRQDPMTDSDFFTESDADDIFHRGDRRAQVIDGQLYGPMLQSSASVFISEDPQMEDSCMESSGIFTDVENRCDEDLAQMRRQGTQEPVDMSPDGDVEGDDSTETVKSNRECGKRARASQTGDSVDTPPTAIGQGQLSCSQTSSTIQSSFSNDRLSAATLSNRTSYCSVDGSAANADCCKSFSSLEEAFAECTSAGDEQSTTIAAAIASSQQRAKSSTTGSVSCCEPQPQQSSAVAPVPRVTSPRKHASLSSLCNVNGAYGAKTETGTPAFANVLPAGSASRSGSKVSLSESVKSASTSASASASADRYSPRVKATQRNPKQRSLGAVGANNTNCNAPVVVRKPHAPNKWDAVMNKIASNKALIKKNYNDVKSKVSTRMSLGVGAEGSASVSVSASATGTPNSNASSPIVRRSPTGVRSVTKVLHATGKSAVAAASPSRALLSSSASPSPTALPTDTGSGSLQSHQAKRLLQGAAKRGRSYSKDSQKSSQSDLSLTSGSPKLLAKTPLRAAKKRDVRNLSISPTDLGPPPKTQQTANGACARPKPAVAASTPTQKRFSSHIQSVSASGSGASTTASTPTSGSGSGIGNGGSIKASPSTKKHSTGRRLEVKTLAKTPLKDHNRIIGSPQATATAAAATKNGSSKPETATELHEISNGVHHNKHNNNNGTAASASQKTPTAITRASSQTPSPLLGQQHGKKGAAGAVAVLLEKKTPRKLLFQKQHPRSTEIAPAPPSAEYLDAAELQQLKLLNRHSCNGRLDYESIERHLQQAELVRQQQDKGVEALGVLLQYLIYDLDAFACPTVKRESVQARESLNKTLQLLEEAKSSCTELQDQICEKEAYYVRREEELQALHRCETEKAQSNFSELQTITKNEKDALEAQLAAKDVEHKRVFECYRLEMENKLAQKRQQIEEAEERERVLQERAKVFECSEQQMHERLAEAEKSYAERLHVATEREHELNERVKVLSKELDTLRATKQNRERELRDKLNLSQDEIAILRTSQRSLNESMERGSSPRNASSTSTNSLELNHLQSEADSLRCVLELKQKELSKLTKQNEELLRDADERVTLQGKISVLESRNEMLQSELEIKSEKEKEFQRQIDDIQKAFNHETVKRTRLSYDNEALQWQLKQRSEQLHIVEAKLQELSAQESSLSVANQISSLCSNSRSSLQNGSSLTAIQVEESSPPVSPIVKGVIEKNDSVSWVLEMDDETPEAAASKMVKRAGSFRSVERSPSTRRQLSLSANAALSMAQATNGAGPNPLSQSMSATSVIRPHSSEAGAEFANRSHSRIRSKSVSVKSTDPAISGAVASRNSKKLTRQHSSGNSRKHELSAGAWNEPICSSSPYYGVRPRTSTMKITAEAGCGQGEQLFRRSSASAHKLITCDTSTLNSGERLEMRSLPTHPSVHDLKARKKCQEIQESAGEAMVSGTNSEDEGCSASSDEVVSSVSTSSVTSGSTSSLHQIKNAPMSLEEVLQLDKINSFNGTPMEVSWSDDVEVFGNSSMV